MIVGACQEYDKSARNKKARRAGLWKQFRAEKLDCYYSMDSGGDFSKIYQGEKTRYLSRIHGIGGDKFSVIGENGLLVNVEFN